jgi:hypothetical protein
VSGFGEGVIGRKFPSMSALPPKADMCGATRLFNPNGVVIKGELASDRSEASLSLSGMTIIHAVNRRATCYLQKLSSRDS